MPIDSSTTVAFLATDGVEEAELTGPWQALIQAGATPVLISLEPGEIKLFNEIEQSGTKAASLAVSDADPDDYAALVIPGGVANGDFLRADDDAVGFVKKFAKSDKPLAVICHAPWVLIEAGVARGKTLTSFPSLKTDLQNAGAVWVDQEVVVDGSLITSRKPDDVPAFSQQIIKALQS